MKVQPTHTALILLLIMLVISGSSPASRAEERVAQGPPAPCGQLSAVPASECAALVEFYNATAGAGWLQSAGWLKAASPASPCDWYGVACAAGHVVTLNLARNRLSGPLPASLGGLPRLERLNLAGNRLQGPLPPVVCALRDTVILADFSYNALESRRDDIRACLEQLDPGWATTQTVAPRELRPAAISDSSVQLGWLPLPAAVAGSIYELSYATALDGPFTTVGQTADARASGYLFTGLEPGRSYLLRVQTITPPHAANPDELRSGFASLLVVTSAPQQTLLIVYFPADNDLASYVDLVIERLRIGTRLNPNVQVVFFSDRAGADDSEVVTIAGGQVTPSDAVFARWGVRELNSADPAVLAWFLRHARASYPAEREIVSLMGHGLALAPEIAWPAEARIAAGMNFTAEPERAQRPAGAVIPPLPKGLDATPGDVTNRGYLSTVGLGRALLEATDDGATPFDLIFFDQCFQGSLDTLYEVRAAADYFIASPNYAWMAAPYDKYLPLMAPAATMAEIASAIISTYQRSLNAQHPNVIFALQRADIELIAEAVSGLGSALSRAVQAGERGPIANATAGSKYVDTTQCGRQNLSLGPPDELIGAGGFALGLRRSFPPNDSFGVQAAASELLGRLDAVQKTFRVGVPYIAPDEIWDYDNTLTILAPLPPSLPDSITWRSSVYTESVPLGAAWTPQPTMTVTVTASFAYARDGAWDDFLAAWYSAPRSPTVGEWCHYTPPALVEEADAAGAPDLLLLSAERASAASALLRWSPTANQDTAAYLVYVRGPYDLGWVQRASLPPSQTSFELSGLVPNASYQLRIVASDTIGEALAQSEAISYRSAGAIYLPLVRR
jgi:hypothetical protein